jgi:hypothetical protein
MNRRAGPSREARDQPMKLSRAPWAAGITTALALGAMAGLGGCKPAAAISGETTGSTQAATSGPPLYRPQLTPRFKAGEVFEYHATSSLDNNMRVIVLKQEQVAPVAAAGVVPSANSSGNGSSSPTSQVTEHVADQNHDTYAVNLVAGALARAVYPNGTLREVAYLVRECQIIHADGKIETLAQADAVLGARRQKDGRVAFAIDGHAPDPAVANNLGLVVQLGSPQGTDDELLGPPGAMPVGAAWSVNEGVLLKSAFAQAYPGTERAVGEFHLNAVQPDQTGHEVVVVSGGFSLEGMRPPFPPQVEALPSVVSFQMLVSSPLKPGEGIDDVDLKTLIHHQGRSGSLSDSISQSETRFDINISLEQHARYTFDATKKAVPALLNAPPVPELPPPDTKQTTGSRMVTPKALPEPPANNAGASAPATPASPPPPAPAVQPESSPSPAPAPPLAQPSFWGGAEQPVTSPR